MLQKSPPRLLTLLPSAMLVFTIELNLLSLHGLTHYAQSISRRYELFLRGWSLKRMVWKNIRSELGDLQPTCGWRQRRRRELKRLLRWIMQVYDLRGKEVTLFPAYTVYSRGTPARVVNISDKSFQSCSATTVDWDHVAVGWRGACCSPQTPEICVSLGFKLAQETCRDVCCTSLLLLFYMHAFIC